MRIYFLGVCGTAMGNAALLARAAGHVVLGADSGVYPPMSTVLREAGVEVFEGYSAERLAGLGVDLVVVGNAMPRGNAEVEWLLNERAVEFTSLPAFLGNFVLKGRKTVVVCGTHGKTTTTAMGAFLLRANGGDPGFLIGGVPVEPPVGNWLGKVEEPFVIEGDEYDSAFFDKRSKFVHYAPSVALINNLEFDHADIFRDLADVQRTFSHLARIVPGRGWIVVNGDDENVRALGNFPWTRVVKVGVGEGNDVRILNFAERGEGSAFELMWREKLWGKVKWGLSGIYNARNAAMAAVGAELGGRCARGKFADGLEELPKLRVEVLEKFRGVRRRQEVLASGKGVTVVEDFGHHPTAVAETLGAFRKKFAGAKLVAVFEPRSNTARTRVLQGGFCEALGLADEVFIGVVNRAEKLREEERFDVEGVIAELGKRRVRARTAGSNGELLELMVREVVELPAKGVRVVVFFSNGSFDGIIGKFAGAVDEARRAM